MDGQLRPQAFLEHADGLMFQVIIGGDSAVCERLNGALVLKEPMETSGVK